MVKAPAFLQAAGGIPGGRAGSQKRHNQPEADVNFRKAGEMEAGPQRAESQECAANKRLSLQLEDGETAPH